MGDEEEQLCRKEFGFELRELQSRLREHGQLMESFLDLFCSVALSPATLPSTRRHLGFAFITEMATSCKVASDHLSHTLTSMRSALLLHMQHEQDLAHAASLSSSVKETLLRIYSRISSDLSFLRSYREKIELHTEIKQAHRDKDLLRKELTTSKASFADEKARLSEDVSVLEAAVQRLRLENAGVEADLRNRFEKEKARLEVSLREEMQLCQICLENRRNVVILPCFHGQFCEGCLEECRKRNKSCPTCRSPIRGMHPYIA